MPKESSPRSLDFFILKSPGKTALIMAHATLIPARALLAPQTICNFSSEASPTSTKQTLNLSALGC